MCNTFQTVNDWHCQIVGRVRLVSCSSPMVRDVLTSVEYGVSQTLHFVLHVQLSSNTVSRCFSSNHVIEVLQILLNSVLAVFRLNAFVALLFHQVSGCIISVSITVGDEFAAVSFDLFKVIGTVRNLVRNNLESFKVSQNVLDELKFLGKWIRVIEAQNHFSTVHFCIMVV